MRAFICVYRQPAIKKKDYEMVQQAALSNPLLNKFMTFYDREDCFYDWGDDPAFFAASEFFGDVNCASWGICRRDVREQLEPRDLVVFFCARQTKKSGFPVDYYYIGFGTVQDAISRPKLWKGKEFVRYQSFFNTLVKYENGVRRHYEPFGLRHSDWEKRIKANYIIFDPSSSDFNLINPLKVATYTQNHNSLEKWFSHHRLVKELQDCVFLNGGVKRRLRTENPYIPHRQIPLHKYFGKNSTPGLVSWKEKLTELSERIRLRRYSLGVYFAFFGFLLPKVTKMG